MADAPVFDPKGHEAIHNAPLIEKIMPDMPKTSATDSTADKGVVVGETTFGKNVGQQDAPKVPSPHGDNTLVPFKGDGTDVEIVDNSDRLSASQEAILDVAKDTNNLGKPQWDFGANVKYTDNGRLGGATSIANMLNKAGFPQLDSASVVGLAQELTDKLQFTEKPLSEGKAGDIIVDRARHRMGIMGENNKIYMMNNQGKWAEFPASVLTSHATARIISPPGTCGE